MKSVQAKAEPTPAMMRIATAPAKTSERRHPGF
jgi:hypothetical protein